MSLAIGLTGGIGSGKSTAASMFAELGVPVLDLDKVGRDVLNQQAIQTHLRKAFGETVFDQDGGIKRSTLATLAFKDAVTTQKLNDIVHPAIREYEAAWLGQQSASYVVIEASVLLESGAGARMHSIVVILADKAVRQARVLARGMQDKLMFDAIMRRQCDDATRLQAADYILQNNDTLEHLQAQVESLHRKLVAL